MKPVRLMLAASDQLLGEDEGREVHIQRGRPYLVTEPDERDEVAVIFKVFKRIPAEFFREVSP